MASEQNGTVTYKVLASASGIVLWGILAYLAVETRADVNAMRTSLANQNTLLEVTRQRVEINSASIVVLDSEHRTISRDVTGIQDQIKYWQQTYGWSGQKGAH